MTKGRLCRCAWCHDTHPALQGRWRWQRVCMQALPVGGPLLPSRGLLAEWLLLLLLQAPGSGATTEGSCSGAAACSPASPARGGEAEGRLLLLKSVTMTVAATDCTEHCQLDGMRCAGSREWLQLTTLKHCCSKPTRGTNSMVLHRLQVKGGWVWQLASGMTVHRHSWSQPVSEACNTVTQVHASGEEWNQHHLFAEVTWSRV